MAPSAVETAQETVNNIKQKVLALNEKPQAVSLSGTPEEPLPQRLEGHKEPLKLSGALDKFEHFDVTPVIGREYANVDLTELLSAPNSDELLRDLAITSGFKFPASPSSLTPR